MNSNSVSHRRPLSAATTVLLRRPAVLLIVVALLVQLGLLIFAVSEGHRISDSQSSVPSHQPAGKRLWSVGNDMYVAYQLGQVDPSIQRLHLDFLDIEQTDGRTVIQFQNESSQTEDVADDIVDLSIPEFADFLKNFPHIQSVSLRSEQLAALPTEILNELPDLKSVEFHTDRLTETDLKKLSLFTNVEHLSLDVAWCECGLRQLAAMPRLKSLNLKSRLPRSGTYRTDVTTRSFMSIENIASVMELPALEELAIEDTGRLLNNAFMTGLTSDCAKEYANFVETIKQSSTLQTVYVGYLRGPRSSDVFEQLSEALPHVSVYPARFNSELATWATLGNLATCLGLTVLTMHLVTCTGGAQNVLLNRASTSHLKVYVAGAAVFLTLPVVTSLLRTHADFLAVVTFESTLFAVVTLFGLMRSGSLIATNNGVSLRRKLAPLLVFPVAALFVLVWIGSKTHAVYVAKLFCGQFPVMCVVALVGSVVMVTSNLKHYLSMHRVMAESGITPATTWAEFQLAGVAQYEMLQQQAAEASAKTGKANPKEDAWLVRLQSTVAQLRQKPESAVVACRLWMAAATSASTYRMLIFPCLLWPLYTMWPALFPFFKGEGSLAAFAEPAQLGFMMGSMIFMSPILVLVHMHTRRQMFEAEILRPVTRSAWRNSTVLSLLFATGLILLTAWGHVNIFRMIAGQSLPLNWIALSLVCAFAATLLATGLSLWALIQNHVLVAAVLVIAECAALAPLIAISLSRRGEISQGGSSHFSMWLIVVLGETLLGIAALKTAWTKWGSLELAQPA